MTGDDAPTPQTTENRIRTAASAPIGWPPARDARHPQLSLVEHVRALQRSTLMRARRAGSGTVTDRSLTAR